MSHEEAVEIIKSAPNPVTFVIQSLLPWVKYCICLFWVVSCNFKHFQEDENEINDVTSQEVDIDEENELLASVDEV